MRPGDFIVGGHNYGMGSSRPAARSLRNIGVACLIAESINGLFFRNAVNFGLLALRMPGRSRAFEEGQTAEVSPDGFHRPQPRDRRGAAGRRISEEPARADADGGIFPLLEREGLIAPAH